MRNVRFVMLACVAMGCAENPNEAAVASAVVEPMEAETYDELYPADESVTFADGNEILHFDTETEFLAWAKTSVWHAEIDEKWSALERERELVVAHQLHRFEVGSPEVAAYLEGVYNRVDLSRAGPGSLNDFANCQGFLHVSDYPAPSISVAKRDRISSYCPVFGHVTVFDRTWYRGQSAFMTGVGVTFDLADLNMDNKTASFF